MNVIGISGLDNSIRLKKREFPNLSARQYRIAQGFDSAAALVTSCGIQAAAAKKDSLERKPRELSPSARALSARYTGYRAHPQEFLH